MKNAIGAHSLKMKATFKLGPSDKLMKDAGELKKYEKNDSPETANKTIKCKRATYQPKPKSTSQKKKK